ncbi:MAG: GNAT family N-acetyltransferase [Halobacteriovorax sp.]|nr:GNAT family N-acetyltransferase [Halobacteriovorax sp.]|tara:strand:- start:30794 stop:31324 length:531 start_codon:yes stop_codon:yes gene_type:complete
MIIRNVEKKDIQGILDIYTPFILDSITTFETEVPSLEEFEKRVLETNKKFPWLVAVENDVVLGYAYGSEHRSRCSYQWSCESSVYLAPEARRKGLGKKLYLELFKILKSQGFIQVLAGAALPNEASVGLHKAMGFTEVGTYKKIGYKKGRWIDTYWMQLELNAPEGPVEIIPYSKL